MKAGQGSCLEEQIKFLLLYLYKVHYKVGPVLFKKFILQINEEVPRCPSALGQGRTECLPGPSTVCADETKSENSLLGD